MVLQEKECLVRQKTQRGAVGVGRCENQVKMAWPKKLLHFAACKLACSAMHTYTRKRKSFESAKTDKRGKRDSAHVSLHIFSRG